MVISRRKWLAALQFGCLVAVAMSTHAQTLLGTAQNFAVLGGAAVTSTGTSAVTGDLGVGPGTAVTGFPPATVVGGTIHVADAVALLAQADTTTAYNAIAGTATNATLTGTDLGGLTLLPGVYRFATSAQLTGTLILDAQGDPDAVFMFQIGSTLTTASSAAVVGINGAQNCNVFWQVGSSATLGTGTSFVGNIIALASIGLNTGASVSGRALARSGAVTMDSNSVSVARCAVGPLIPPALAKSFTPATIAAGGVSMLTITLSNPEASAATLTAPLIDTLTGGMVVAAIPAAATTCPGTGSVTAAAGTTVVSLPATRSIPATGSCTITVSVTASPGIHLNTLPAGALQTSNGGNTAAASATLAVNSTVTLAKAYGPAMITAGGVSTLTITLGNTSVGVAALTSALVDTLTGGAVIAAVPNASTTCSGSGTVVATAGGTVVTLPATRSIPAASSCTVTVNVTAPAGASYVNTLGVGALKTDRGDNAVAAGATLTVNAVPPAPTLGKAFVPASIGAGVTSTLTITLINPGLVAATLNAALTDVLPIGVVVASTPNAGTTCAGGVLAGPPAAGDTAVTLSAATIPSAVGVTAGTCTVTIDVTAATGGSYVNTIAAGGLATNQGSNAAPATARLDVVNAAALPPTLAKGFAPASFEVGTVAVLTITLRNPNATVAALTAPLTDVLPAGLVVAAVPNAGTTCAGTGAVAATAGGSTVILPATRSIPGGAPGTCTVTVSVIAGIGTFVNLLPVNALQTTNGNNANAASATAFVTAASFAIPALSVATMIFVSALLAVLGAVRLRRRI